MTRLPLLLSVPHAGWRTPPEVADYSILTQRQIDADGDEGARAIYGPLEDQVEAFRSTEIGRAFVDLNRAPDDRRQDGVVKTHTCWNEPIYDPTPPESVFETMLEKYYFPYHRALSEASKLGAPLAIDCHTMAAQGPPVGPDPGAERPWVCLSDGDGATCPPEWMRALRAAFAEAFEDHVQVNDPFRGGYITRRHAAEMPWVQLELSRAPFLSDSEKGARTLEALRRFVKAIELHV